MNKYRNKIEEYGASMEGMGLSPVAARVYIYLLYSKEEDATFEEIVSFFKFSKSAVSNALKTLTAGNMVESKTVEGQRKRYFEVNFDKMLDHDEMTSRFRTYYLMLDDICKQRGEKDKLASGLSYASGLYKLMMTEYPLILERWKKMNKKNKKSS